MSQPPSSVPGSLAPCWERCLDCDDYWCTVHHQHVADCQCPGIEEWEEAGVWPYLPDKAG